MGSIVWLASYPKSGNTWLRIFLLNLFANSSEPLPPSAVNRLSTGDVVLDYYRKVDDRDPRSWSFEEVAGLRHEVQRHIAGLREDSMLLKTHAALVPMAGRPPFAMEVSGGAVYVVRNPLDIVPSYARHLGKSHDEIIEIMSTPNYTLPRTAQLAEFIQGGWSQNVASWTATPNPMIHVVRYEDLVASPVERFGAVCRFLKLVFDDARLERAIGHASLPTLMRLEDEHGFVERTARQNRFFGEGGVGAWRDALTEAQARRLVARHRPQMSRFGYVPEGF